jgi:hypothetical protein
VTSQEAETFAGDVNQIVVDEPKLLMSNLSPAPGRNYSISIQALSNGVESEEVVLYQVTSKLRCNYFLKRCN